MSIVQYAPKLTLTDAAQLAEKLYGLTGEVASLPSERDQNFLMKPSAGEFA